MMRTTMLSRQAVVVSAVGIMVLLAAGEAGAQDEDGNGLCSYSLSSDSITVDADEYSGTFTYSSSWTAPQPVEPGTICITECSPASCEPPVATVSPDSWITVTRDSNTVTYTVAANARVSNAAVPQRTGTVIVGGFSSEATFTVNQDGLPACAPAPGVAPTSLEFSSAAGEDTVGVNEESNCEYPVSDDRSWITASPSPVPGNGTVRVRVRPNDGAERSGTVSVGGRSISITQDAAPPPPCPTSPNSLTPSSRTSPYQGEAFDVDVSNERTDCSFPASSNRSWIGVGASSVDGGGTVRVTVAPNDGAQRSGAVTIGGRSISITQDAAPPPPCPTSPNSLTPSSRTSPYQGEAFDVDVSNERTDCSFPASSNRSWIGVGASSVDGGGTVRVTVAPNDGAQRSGAVTIGGRSISITQDAAPLPPCPSAPVSSSDETVGHGGGTFEEEGTAGSHCGPYTVRVSTDNGENWLHADESSIRGHETVEITVDRNRGGGRAGTVAIGTARIRIEQGAAPCPSAPVSSSDETVGHGGGTFEEEGTAGSHCGPYTVRVSTDNGENWLHADESSIRGHETVEITVDRNRGGGRAGTVAIGTARIRIEQGAAPCPSAPVSSSDETVGHGGGTFEEEGTAGSHCGPYTVRVSTDNGENWLHADESSIRGHETVEITVDRNLGGARGGTVMIGTASIGIRQGAAPCPSAPVIASTINVGHGGGTVEEEGTAGSHCGPYSVTVSTDDGENWLGASPSSIRGNGTVEITVDRNLGGARAGTVAFWTASIRIEQGAAPCPAAPGVVATSVTFGADGTGAGGVEVSGSDHCGYDVEVSSGAAAWLSVDVTRASGGDTVTLSATVNSGGERMGTVTVGGASVQVTQAAGCPASPGGVPGGLDYGSGAASQAVVLTDAAGCSYAVATDDAAWITVDPASAAGNGTVTVTVTEHTGTVVRTGTVTIGLQLVSVTQAGGCQAAPGVTVPLVAFGNGGGVLAVGVGESSVCEYAVTADPAWVTVQPARVTGGGTVTVTVPEDLSGGGPRRGAVTIGASGVRVAQGNTPPVAAADAVTTWRETATPVAVLANDTDADADPLAVAAVVTAPAQGTAAVSADGQTVTYTSAMGWAGDETFTYQVTDDVGGTAEATVTVTVRAATPFTDPVLTVGVTPVKAAHMMELRTRADAVRVGCGLTAATWTDPVLTAGVTPIKAAHMTELRAAVTVAYAACTQTAPAWTDPVLEVGVTPIKAAHLLELREAVIALE